MNVPRVPRRLRRASQALFLLLGLVATATARAETVVLALASGTRVEARIEVPAGVDGRRLPAVILFGGFERGAAALDLVRSARPTLLASFDYPLRLPRKPGVLQSVRALPVLRRGIRESFEAAGLLYAHLRERPDVDPARISIVGVSFGAPLAVQAAAAHRIPGLAVIHGFGAVDRVLAHQVRIRLPAEAFWAAPLARVLGWSLAAYGGLRDIDAQAAALEAGQRVWMLSARDDALIPPAGTRALRRAFERSDAQFVFEWEDGGHLTGDTDPRIPALLRRTERWLVDSGL